MVQRTHALRSQVTPNQRIDTLASLFSSAAKVRSRYLQISIHRLLAIYFTRAI